MPQEAHASELHRIVRIGEGIRVVVDTAREVDLAALNAMLSSRRGGESAVGFRVASNELRGISTGLVDTMQGLTALVAKMVNEVAQRQRKQGSQTYYARVRADDTPSADRVALIFHQQAAQIDALNTLLEQRRRLLDSHVQRALRSCDQGLTLSRGALIEAAYGGDSAPALRQAAEQLARSIQSLSTTLRRIRTELDVVPS
jgi:hypothetical protein